MENAPPEKRMTKQALAADANRPAARPGQQLVDPVDHSTPDVDVRLQPSEAARP